uniref:Actin-binding protein anillin (inferred by orthology to a human protein) n=1 Tax=Nippostrongylus brasiliensis TaxID=27835 RepID=A0A0N4XCN8_NIPBR
LQKVCPTGGTHGPPRTKRCVPPAGHTVVIGLKRNPFQKSSRNDQTFLNIKFSASVYPSSLSCFLEIESPNSSARGTDRNDTESVGASSKEAEINFCNLCGEAHFLSAQRTLLLARERLELLRCEVNRISALAAVRNPPPPVSRDLRGTMTISNITVHLNRSFYTSYALLILLKCGAEVEATGPISLLAHQQTRIRHLTFAEHVQFANLPVDFNVVVEVYAMKLPTPKEVEQSCASNIANKCRNLLSPALTTRPGRALCRADSQVSEFVRCGYIILNRDTVGANKFYLDEAEYPLEGIIEVYARCTTLPPAIEVDNRGFLVSLSGMASWERYWSVLRRGMVYFWRYPDDESLEKRPVAFMDLSKCTNDVVVACTPEQCPRENSFSIDMLVSTTPSMMEKKRYVETDALVADYDFLLLFFSIFS